MGAVSTNIARQIDAERQRRGTDVTFDGVVYRVFTKRVAGAITGAQTLSVEALGPFIASADPRQFNFSPFPFKPYTAIQAPQEGDIILWHGLRYLCTVVTYSDQDDDTLAVIINAFRHVQGG